MDKIKRMPLNNIIAPQNPILQLYSHFMILYMLQTNSCDGYPEHQEYVSRQIIVVTTDFWFAPFSTLVGKTR
jgi:hypothetical protein